MLSINFRLDTMLYTRDLYKNIILLLNKLIALWKRQTKKSNKYTVINTDRDSHNTMEIGSSYLK